MPRFVIAWLGVIAALPLAVAASAADGSRPAAASPPSTTRSRKLKPRDPIRVGDQWRVRVSTFPMQMPEPAWIAPETWLFAAVGVEKTPDGPRLFVTATREKSLKPALRLQLDPETQALIRAEIITPTQQGERVITERPAPGEPYVSELSPVPLVFLAPPLPAASKVTVANGAAGESATAEQRPTAGGEAQPALAFSFGTRLTQRVEPVDAGVGRAKIERGMAVLTLGQRARMEPLGVPRSLTVVEGPGLRVEQVWDETTPWPLFTQTGASRSWLVTYTKGK